MAEKYGTIPPKFTSEWFDYVWTYYKWHIIVPILVIAFVAVTVYQCTHRTAYDVDVIYAGQRVFTSNQEEQIPAALAAYVDDVNGDGETLVSFQQINFNNTKGAEEMDYNLQMKLDLQFQTNSAYLFLFDKTQMDLMLARDDTDKIYLPVSEWGVDMPSEDMLYTEDGIAYGVSLAGNEKIKAAGINTDDVYIIIRQNYSDKDEDTLKYQNALKLARGILNNT